MCTNIRTPDHYLEKYLPLRVQNFIIETLKSVLPEKEQNKLENFEKLNYEILNDDIIRDDEIGNLRSTFYRFSKVNISGNSKSQRNRMKRSTTTHHNSPLKVKSPYPVTSKKSSHGDLEVQEEINSPFLEQTVNEGTIVEESGKAYQLTK